ncbi:LysR substrate-binding domain-containing protein, partial [Acinetobacter sp. LH3_13]|uniref:LysR substrate-binding domain-containing protein n=1 Tax=Acinetobacter sp. LH3_13 TaxID=3434463 RepID=UPI003EB6DD89
IAIAMRAADVAIWTSEPQQSDLIRRPLFNMKIHAYASTQYVRRYGAPQSIEALDGHPIISYSGTPAAHLSAVRALET